MIILTPPQLPSPEMVARDSFRETLIKCGADTPVRVKAAILHTFRYKKILVQGSRVWRPASSWHKSRVSS